MHTSQLLLRLGASLLCTAGIANANYAITDTFDNTNFFDEWNFFSGADPTNGFVKYASSALANTSSLAGYSGNSIYLGVDSTTVNPTGGRASVRVSSQNTASSSLTLLTCQLLRAACGQHGGLSAPTGRPLVRSTSLKESIVQQQTL
jgi:hypothetical protein